MSNENSPPKNVLWCIGFISGQSCYLNVTQEEAELRWRAENEGEMQTIMKVEFDDMFESYMVYGGNEVEPVTPDPIDLPVFVPSPPRKPDSEQVLDRDIPDY